METTSAEMQRLALALVKAVHDQNNAKQRISYLCRKIEELGYTITQESGVEGTDEF